MFLTIETITSTDRNETYKITQSIKTYSQWLKQQIYLNGEKNAANKFENRKAIENLKNGVDKRLIANAKSYQNLVLIHTR